MSAAGATPPDWGAESLWEALVPLLPGLSVEVVEQLGSTNTELLGRLRGGGDAAPQLLVATHQTAGRGRLGRTWHATAGGSLTFSLALPIARADWSGLSLAVGLAVADALDPDGARIGLKWPNDLVLRGAAGAPGPGRKLGGILIESVAAGGGRVAVIGIGINVAGEPLIQADYGVACLGELTSGATPQAALARLAVPLARTLLAFEAGGFAPMRTAYARRDVLHGREVRTTDATLPEGTAAGVDEDGALLVAHAGRQQRILSGEVSVRLAPAAGA